MLERIVDGRTDLVFDYVASGHSPESSDDRGVSLMQWCAYYGDVSAIRFLIQQGAKLTALGENLDLNGAAFHGHWQLCQFLIENGADVNRPLPDTGETPLHAATSKANRPAYDLVVQVLLANGAKPNCTTKPDIETGAFMRDCRTKGETPLHRAAAFGTEATIKMLLDAGATIDARDMNGETPLSWASWNLRSGPVLKLLCYGEHRMSPAGVAHYSSDRGAGWGGMEASLRGKPHV